mmetsp:Transcript_7372/g.15379  ORF Transcript_7372/g.15379 Transcript_7372/m.15379 type:complete len:81 (+) Transcript_7372:356-598(+)
MVALRVVERVNLHLRVNDGGTLVRIRKEQKPMTRLDPELGSPLREIDTKEEPQGGGTMTWWTDAARIVSRTIMMASRTYC